MRKPDETVEQTRARLKAQLTALDSSTASEDLEWLGGEEPSPWADEEKTPTTRTKKPAKKRKKTARVESTAKLRGEKARFKDMAGTMLGKKRAWMCDGEYVAFRRKSANPAILERHNRFMQAGHYAHVGTYDDVELYELQEASPFKRAPLDLLSMTVPMIRRIAAVAACKRDWGTYIDAVQELAGKIKGQVYTDGKPADSGFAMQQYTENLEYVFHLIRMRQGPSPDEMNRGVISARQLRGDSRNRLVILPGSPRVQ